MVEREQDLDEEVCPNCGMERSEWKGNRGHSICSERTRTSGGAGMNSDVLQGRWKQLRGDIKTWWGRLTDDDLERVAGQKDRLVGLVQEKYGYTREKALQEVDARLGAVGTRGPAEETPGGPMRTTSEEGEAQLTGGAMAGSTPQESATATSRANAATAAVGEKLGAFAGTLREKAPQAGAVHTAASAVADRLETAGSYLQENDLGKMADDMASLIRRYPVQSLLLGLGMGYGLGRSRGR